VIPEAPLEPTEHGLVPAGDGWFVANARDARWWYADGRSAICDFEAETDVRQFGVNITVLKPGESLGMYHWEADQEDFLVVAGEALLIVEDEERPLRQWDFFHCPPGTKHIIVGAGDGPCVVVAVGGRAHEGESDWGGYTVSQVALRHGAGVEQETTVPREAYARLARRAHTRYREGWLPDY
jgi:uncharacterized cupin superfamily protein